MQEKTNIQTSTLRVPKSILEEIKIYCRKAGKPVGEWVETAWKFIEKNDFDIYDKETTPFLPVPPDIEKERNQVEALCMLMSEFITAQKQIQLPAPELIAKAAEEKVRAEMKAEEQAKELQVLHALQILMLEVGRYSCAAPCIGIGSGTATLNFYIHSPLLSFSLS